MITLEGTSLVFTFPEVHPAARLAVRFERTLRIPDDGRDYPLPAGLGDFALRHVDDFAARLPASWLEHGGVMLPMYQAEAMWLSFDADEVAGHGAQYRFAVTVAAGKVNALTGEPWRDGLAAEPQSYMAVPPQPWLDGSKVAEGVIRQFVAMPMGSGTTTEEQLHRSAEVGGLQIAVVPMRRAAFERRFPRRPERVHARFCVNDVAEVVYSPMRVESPRPDMGLALGGRMRQEIYEDPYDLADWQPEAACRCFVHLLNAPLWPAVTGEPAPHPPVTADDYRRRGIPWFDYYGADRPLPGSPLLARLKSLAGFTRPDGSPVLPDNEPLTPQPIKPLRANLEPGQVREGRF